SLLITPPACATSAPVPFSRAGGTTRSTATARTPRGRLRRWRCSDDRHRRARLQRLDDGERSQRRRDQLVERDRRRAAPDHGGHESRPSSTVTLVGTQQLPPRAAATASNHLQPPEVVQGGRDAAPEDLQPLLAE